MTKTEIDIVEELISAMESLIRRFQTCKMMRGSTKEFAVHATIEAQYAIHKARSAIQQSEELYRRNVQQYLSGHSKI